MSWHDRIRRGCELPNEPLLVGPARPCIFFDRDGVLNRDGGFVHRAEELEWVEGARDAVQFARASGWWSVVVTNQGGIARGYHTEDDLIELSRWMLDQIPLDLILYCPHYGDPLCFGRKPNSGMLQSANALLPIDRSHCVMFGDRDTDMAAAAAFEVPGRLFHDSQNLLFAVKEATLDWPNFA